MRGLVAAALSIAFGFVTTPARATVLTELSGPAPESDRWCRTRLTAHTHTATFRFYGRMANASSAVAAD